MNRFVKAFAALLAVISFWCAIPAIPVMAAEYSLSATTYFRDANFRTYLKQFDTDGNGSLSSTEIANIKVVDLRNAGVTNTKGIYYLTAIEELYISGSPTEPNSGGQPMEFHCENFPNLRILDVRGLSKDWGFYITGCDKLKFIYSDGNINIWGNSAAPDTVNATYVNAVIFAVNANNPNAHYESTGVYKRYWYTNPNNPSQILIDIKYTSQGTGFKIGQSFPTAAQLPGFSTTPNTPTPRVTNTTAPRPTNTNTPRVTATNTPKPTNTNTPKPTNTNTPKPTNTNTPKPTNTNTPKPTNTNTPRPTATNTPRPTATNTPRPTATNTPRPTATNTPRPTATNTPRPTATNTPRPTATNTPRPTATNTPRPTATNTPRPTATNTPRPTATNTPRPTVTNTPRPTATNTPRPTATNTPRPSTPTPTPQGVVNMKLTNWGTNSQISLTGTNLPNTSDVIVKFSVDGGTNLAPNIWNPNDISASVSGNIVTLTIKKSALANGVTFQLGSSTTMGQFRVISASQAANILKVTTTGTTTAIVSATPTPRVTATSTPRPTATNTPRPTATNTPRPTATNTPRPTARPTNTNTPRPTNTNTPRPTNTNTPRPTATNTPRPSTPTPTPQGVVNMKLTNWGTNSQITLTGTNLPNTSDVIVKFSVDSGTNLRPNFWTPNDISASVSGNIVTLTIKKSALVSGVTFQLGSSTTMGQFRVISASQAANILKVTTTGTTTAIVSATPTPRVTATNTPRPTATNTPRPTATNTPRPTNRPTNTNTPRPTATNTPRPTNRPTNTNTPRPTATNTPRPTNRPVTTLPPFDPNLSGSGVGGFVDRIYQVVLNRAVPSTPGGGKDYWMGELTSGRRNGGQVATIFLISDEFTSKGYTDEQFVEVLYRLFFNRSMGSNLSNNYWVLELKNNRRTRQNIIAEFINSQEWANTCFTYGIASGGSCRPNITVTPSADIVAFVTRFYTEGLKKDAPASAVNYWAGELSGGTKTAREVAVAFLLGSDLTSQGTSNTEFSSRVYKTLLGRAPTTDELRAATAICRSSTTGAGNGRTDLVNMIINSNEFAAICARLGIRYGGTGNPAAAKISVPDVDSAAYELEILEIEAEDEAAIAEANEDAVPAEAEAVTEEVIEIEEEILEEEVIEEEVFEETSEAVEDVETEIVEDVIEA